MKATRTLGLATLLLLGCLFRVNGQATAYANIYATVVAPVGIEKKADLTFSQIVPTQNSGTVVLGSTALATTGKGTMASFSVSGGNQTFDVTVPNGTFAIRNGGADTMLVGNFTSSQTQMSSVQGNRSTVTIGATLFVSGNQAAGSYQAQEPFLVTLNYN